MRCILFSPSPELKEIFFFLIRSLLAALRFFTLRRIRAAVEFVHSRIHSIGQNLLHCLCCRIQHFINQRILRFPECTQHVPRSVSHFVIRRDSQPNPLHVLAAQRSQDGLHPVMPSRTALLPHPNRTQPHAQFLVKSPPIPGPIRLVL